MAVIEFNERAKPEMAKPFGGILEVGKIYKTLNGSAVKISPPIPDWKLVEGDVVGEFLTGVLKSGRKIWHNNGIFQGMELACNYKYHIKEEWPDFKDPDEKLQLKIGEQYVTKDGRITEPLDLHQIFNDAFQTIVLRARIMNVDGSKTSMCYFNANGEYLGFGSGPSKLYPISVRTLVAKVV